MKKIIVLAGIVAFAFSCSKVAVTGRKQLSLVPDNEINKMSFSQYDEVKNTSKLVADSDPRTQMIKRVGEKIANSVTQYMTQNNLQASIEGFSWEFNLIDEETVNAWCMPGGKVAFYTGILPITQDELGVAVVMGHEVAHAVAKHGSERMSQGLVANGLLMGLQTATSMNPSLTNNLLLMSVGLGSQLGILKFSRSHESEADRMGLIFMAMAGYQPEAAVGFWERMAAAGGGQKPPEMLSTHPSDDRRISDIKKHLVEAKKYYKPQ